MRASSRWALAAIVLAAIGIRLWPVRVHSHWGSDVGEYYAILRDLLASGRVSTDYAGWGITYPYFPGMFFIQGAAVDVGGLSAPVVVNLLVPVLGGLVALPVFVLAASLARDERAGLFAAALVAVAFPHAFPTSHTAPATLGDLLAIASLLLFVKVRRDSRALPLVVLVGLGLVVTHHLSLYFLLVMEVASLFVRGLIRPARLSRGTLREIGALGLVVAATLGFWLGYATTFRDGILRDVDVQPWWLLLAAAPVAVGLMALLVVLRRRTAWRYRPRLPDLRRSAILAGVALAAVYVVLADAVFVFIPGTTIALSPAALILFAPLYVLVSFSAAGRQALDMHPDGIRPTAWLLGLVGSVLVGAAFAPRTLIPYRHMEYVIIVLAIFAGLGFVRTLDLAALRPRARSLATLACAGLLAASALSVYPSRDVLGGWQEGLRPQAVDAAYWSRDRVDGLLLADHQASNVAFGFGGVDATWDRTTAPLLAPTFEDARAGMLAVPSPSGVRDVAYAWVDEDTERGVALYPWEPAAPMPPEAVAKFSESPFVKLFDNGFARVYWVAWGCDGSC